MNDAMQRPADAQAQARESYTGRRLTDSQFETAWNIAGIIHREIRKTGSFIEPLTDYARTFAGRDKLDASREEGLLGDIYAARYGDTMNQTRERLLGRDASLRETPGEAPIAAARSVLSMIEDGQTLPFYQALDRAALDMAATHGVTEACAKSLMKEAYEAQEGRPLYEVGKEREAQFHAPVRDAERAARNPERRRPARSGPRR